MINRRVFQHSALALTLGTLALPAQAQSAHRELSRPAPVDKPPPAIEVVDFFWYGCPHCNAFAPILDPWIEKLPADVSLRHVPVAFQSAFTAHQRLFFTLEAMGQIPRLHRRVFNAIHVERQRLDNKAAILGWVKSQPELDSPHFEQLYESFGIASKAQRATQLQDAYGVGGVPSLGVGGRYYVDGDLAGSMHQVLAEVDRLVIHLRQSRRR